MSIAEALDDYPPGQKPFSSRVSYHSDVSLRCVQITAIGYMVEALEKRNIKLANSILMHIVCRKLNKGMLNKGMAYGMYKGHGLPQDWVCTYITMATTGLGVYVSTMCVLGSGTCVLLWLQGLDVHSSLRHVCFNTLDVELKNFLVSANAIHCSTQCDTLMMWSRVRS